MSNSDDVQTTTFPAPGNVQGNVLQGFSKDLQRFMFFRIVAPPLARAWIGDAADRVVDSSADVGAFNDLFKKVRKSGRSPRLAATWANIAFTFSGLETLDVSDADMAGFETAFRESITERAATAAIGDSGASSPTNWEPAYRASEHLHMLVIVAGDDARMIEERSTEIRDSALTTGAFELVHEESGRTRRDVPGHEHFGFRDGISQPRPQLSADAPTATDGTSAWDFVIDALTPRMPPPASQAPSPTNPSFAYGTQPTHVPDPTPEHPKHWMHEGSYVVFRKLAQDVAAFEKFIDSNRGSLGADVFGAKLVGRYKSGYPLAKPKSGPTYDPLGGDPTTLATPVPYDDDAANDFDFSADPSGLDTPLAAHVQKVNPRFGPGSRPRLIRRGIPYGEPYVAGAKENSASLASAPRGLLFVSYQASIEAQFEFINGRWVNNVDFPAAGAGVDPIIGQTPSGTCPFALPKQLATGASTPTVMQLQIPEFVTTRGCAYLFQPSIDGLKHIAGLDRGL